MNVTQPLSFHNMEKQLMYIWFVIKQLENLKDFVSLQIKINDQPYWLLQSC
ncbi:unnamed protein product [Paramecium sonneborni]|uniref:Uncharacterized protein n=1 Tax=Paramecium sonneborni TaxID=65129 RepID=A0A8S1PY27_9CILI|nr:unnamed protein product [Paramecium sonneborni]